MLLHPWKHLLTNVHTAKKQWHFSLVRGFLWKWWRDMIGFLSWLSDCGSITFIWKFVGNIFIPTESGVTYINSWFFFLQSCSLLSNSSKKKKKKGKQGCIFFTAPRTCLGNASKCTQLLAITWIITALHGPHALVSAQTELTGHQCVVVVEQRAWAWGQAKPQSRGAATYTGDSCIATQPMGHGLDTPDLIFELHKEY